MKYIPGDASSAWTACGDIIPTVGEDGYLPVYEDPATGEWYYTGSGEAPINLILKISNLIGQEPTGTYKEEDEEDETTLPGTTRKDLLKDTYGYELLTGGDEGGDEKSDNTYFYLAIGVGIAVYLYSSSKSDASRRY
jgi:hypothetical protein